MRIRGKKRRGCSWKDRYHHQAKRTPLGISRKDEKREGGRGRWGGDSLVRRGLYICRPKGIPARIAFFYRMGESRRRPKLEIEHQHLDSHMGENICWRREQRRGPGARHGIRSRARSQGAKVGGSGARFMGQNRVRIIRLANLEGLRTIQLRTGIGGWSTSPKQSSLPRHPAGSSGLEGIYGTIKGAGYGSPKPNSRIRDDQFVGPRVYGCV
jgi:hypothetical protein